MQPRDGQAAHRKDRLQNRLFTAADLDGFRVRRHRHPAVGMLVVVIVTAAAGAAVLMVMMLMGMLAAAAAGAVMVMVMMMFVRHGKNPFSGSRFFQEANLLSISLYRIFHPSATSRIIISKKPASTDSVPARSAPPQASGISSRTVTSSIAPAAKPSSQGI